MFATCSEDCGMKPEYASSDTSPGIVRLATLFKKRLSCGILFLIVFSTAACAHRPPSGTEVPLVWPGPPDEPKIQYLSAIRSGSDINATRSTSPEIIDGLRKPYGVAVDSDGRIYVTDSGRVLFFDRNKLTSGSFGYVEGEGKLVEPIGIAVSKDGRVFVTDVVAGRVMVFSTDGKPRGGVGRVGDFTSPAGIALDETGKKIYVVDSKKHRVNVYSLKDYSFLYTFGSRGTSGEGKFNFPTNVAVDSKGNLYVVDTGNFKVQVFDRNSAYVKSIGKAGDLPGTMARPKGIAIDSEDHIYVVDAAFQNVQVFDSEGKLLIAFGKGGLGPGDFTLPAGLTIDSKDRIYVVDQWPGNVQLFQYLKEQPAEQGTQRGGR